MADKATKVYLDLSNVDFESTVNGAVTHVVVTDVPDGFTEQVVWLQTEFRFNDDGSAQYLKLTQWYNFTPTP